MKIVVLYLLKKTNQIFVFVSQKHLHILGAYPLPTPPTQRPKNTYKYFSIFLP